MASSTRVIAKENCLGADGLRKLSRSAATNPLPALWIPSSRPPPSIPPASKPSTIRPSSQSKYVAALMPPPKRNEIEESSRGPSPRIYLPRDEAGIAPPRRAFLSSRRRSPARKPGRKIRYPTLRLFDFYDPAALRNV